MAEKTVIGAGTFIRGDIRGDGDLEIFGRVEGEIEVDGDVTVAEGALVKGNVGGRRVHVRGAVAGDLVGGESVALEHGARVVGDLRSPRSAWAKVRSCADGSRRPTPRPVVRRRRRLPKLRRRCPSRA